jgi:hypothetical protein
VVFGSLHHLPILHESHRTVDSIYFRNHALISVVIVNARTVEAGVVGNEGIVGLEGLMGLKRGPLREIVQTDKPRLFSDDAGYGAEQRDRGRAFAKKKIIQHPRGSLRILNRKALEESSCDLLRADSRLQRRAHRLGGLLGDLFRELLSVEEDAKRLDEAARRQSMR